MNVNLIYYIDKTRGDECVRSVHSKYLLSLEKMRDLYVNQKKRASEQYFIGTVITSKVVAPKKGGFGTNGANENARRYDRIFVVHDAMNNFGHCAAICFENGNDSRSGCKFLDDKRPLNGMRFLLTGVGFKGVGGVEYLGGERDLPILSFEEMYPLQEGRSIWMLQSTIDMHIATDTSITRAITYKRVFLRVKNVELKSANCSGMFCDRSLCPSNNGQTESKCICFPKMYSQGGQLTLCMDIEMYKERAPGTGVVEGNELSTIFHPFQSLEWSKLLLGSDIQSTNSNVSEWSCGINNLRKFVDDRVNAINLEGGWNIFGWYKNGMIENKVEIPSDPSGGGGTGGGTAYVAARKKESSIAGRFGALTVKPHIVRIIPALNKPYWLDGEGADDLQQYKYKEDEIDETQQVPAAVRKDEIVNERPF
jgi:hypothetical protein